MIPDAPLRLRLDGEALAHNWRALDQLSGAAACGAAVKADGYGLGVREVVTRLRAAGCRDFYVATWEEAAEIADLMEGAALTVFHGVREEDMRAALASPARPCLNTPQQVARWREARGGACDAMVDTGINRLGLAPADVADGLLDGLELETLMSHLACADKPGNPMNPRQRDALASLSGRTGARRLSLANSAGIVLGDDYCFDLTRPGLSLYGGTPTPETSDYIVPVAWIEAQVLQRRTLRAGESIGYNATWIAQTDVEIAILNIGYADGYWRSFSNGRGGAFAGDVFCPVTGLTSMDLTAIDVSDAAWVVEGDWVELFDELYPASVQSGLSQYELLTGLGRRYRRDWV